MIYYKDENNKIYAYEDNVDKKYIKDNLIAITETEYKSFKLFGVFDKTEDEIEIQIQINDLEKAKIDKKNEIKQAFNNVLKQGYTCSNGIKMDAKSDDIILLKSGYDLAKSLGQDTMTITDYDNIDHTDITLDDVYTMIQELGVNFETQRVKKNSLKAQVDEVKIDEETAIDDVNSIVWS